MISPNNRKTLSIAARLLFLVFLIVGSVYIITKQQTAAYQKKSGKTFGTYYHITYQSDRILTKEIEEVLKAVDNSLSMFNKHSTISKINGNQSDSTDKLLTEVYEIAQNVSKITDGAFDITVAPLVNLWGFGFDSNHSPTDKSIDSILHFVGFEKIQLKGNKIIKSDARQMLDFSAIAKGYACDKLAKLFNQYDIRNYMIEIGGEVYAKGRNSEKQPWRIGVSLPEEVNNNTSQEKIIDVIHSEKIALATSGNYRNFYYKDGKRYAHTINPKSGRPVEHTLLSATVMTNSCAKADAFATAFMVLGLEKSKQIVKTNKDIEAYLIYTDKDNKYNVWCSAKMKKLLDND